MNRFASALSTATDLSAAITECARQARQQLEGADPHLGFLFISHDHQAGFARVGKEIQAATGVPLLLGCAGETVVGPAQEVEGGPALALWLAHMPEASLTPMEMVMKSDESSVSFEGAPRLPQDPQAIKDRQTTVILLGEPHSFGADFWLRAVNETSPSLPVFGGMASGGHGPGQNRLFVQDRVLEEGAIGVVVEGVSIRSVVSQGCRPVGRKMVITRSHDNIIEELAGKPPLEQLQDIFQNGDEAEKRLLQAAAQSGALHIGQVVDELIDDPGRGDFLVRNVMGSDQESGHIAIGDYARRGRTVRFHVRDADSADEDLRELLDQSAADRPAGALLFSCNGRGTRFFNAPHHDARCLETRFEGLPVAGFFAQGEIGPVGGRNFLHGFTASVALFDKA